MEQENRMYDREALLLTVEQAADALKISRSSAYRAANRGQLPVVRIGRRMLIPRLKLEAMFGVEPHPSEEDEEDRAIRMYRARKRLWGW